MVITIYCANPGCEAYKKPVKYTFVYLRRSKACVVCGSPMVDGERSNDDFKNGTKAVTSLAGLTRRAPLWYYFL
jgi:hypothetical protein